MNNKKALLLLVLFAALLTSGCGVKDQIEDRVNEEINAAVPLGDLAFTPIDLSKLGTAFNCLRPLALICLIGVGWSVHQWLKYEGEEEGGSGWVDLITGGAGKWFLLMILVLQPSVFLTGFNEIGKVAWPDGLNITFVRNALGWKIPILEALLPEHDALVQSLGAALATIPIALGWHVAYQMILAVTFPVAIVVSIVFRSLKPLFVWFAGFLCWAFFGTAWYTDLTFIQGYRGGNFLVSTLKLVNTVFLITTWALMIILSFLPIGAPLLAWVVGKVRGIGLGEAAWEAGQTAFLSHIRRGGKGNERDGNDSGGGRGSGRGGGKQQLPPSRQTSKRRTRPSGEPKTTKAKGKGKPEVKVQPPTAKTSGKKQLPPARQAGESKDRPGQPKVKGEGKQLPTAREPGKREAKAEKLSKKVEAPVSGALKGAGGPLGEVAVKVAEAGPDSMLSQASKAMDQAEETWSRGESQDEERTPLPPSRPARSGRTRINGDSPIEEDQEPSFEPQMVETVGGRTRYYIDGGDITDDEGTVLFRDGQMLFPDRVTDEGLVVGEHNIPWDKAKFEGEVD